MRRPRRSEPPSNLDLLAGFEPFDRCPPKARRELAPHVDRLQVRPGTLLARRGELARSVVVVLSGTVRAERGAQSWSGGRGTQIGGHEVLQGGVHDVAWYALSDVEVLVVNGPAYRWAVQEASATAA
jgi:CRP-like cAMP-binding protein